MSKIYYFDKKVIEFKFQISSIVDIDDRYIILFKIPSTEVFSENVFCISKQGETLWQIEKMEMPHEFSSYYELHYQNKELFVYTNSLERIVDVDSGKIIKTEFVK